MTAEHPVLRHFPGIRQQLRRRHQVDFAELARAIDELEEAVREHCHCHHGQPSGPATVTVTSTDQEGNTMATFAPGAVITFTAASTNAEQQPVTDTYTWSASAGTVVPSDDTTTATIADAPLGDLTVTATDPAGLAGSVTVTVADQTPVAVTVTAA